VIGISEIIEMEEAKIEMLPNELTFFRQKAARCQPPIANK